MGLKQWFSARGNWVIERWKDHVALKNETRKVNYHPQRRYIKFGSQAEYIYGMKTGFSNYPKNPEKKKDYFCEEPWIVGYNEGIDCAQKELVRMVSN